jgi:hypothetical protein
MGADLYRWLSVRLPDELTMGERMVALAVADLAHDRTRIAHQENAMAIVTVRCGYTMTKTTGKTLAKLGARGIELRRQITTDKLGRPVFAVRGREVEFYVPTLGECPALLTDEQVAERVAAMSKAEGFGPALHPDKLSRLVDAVTNPAKWSPRGGSNGEPKGPNGPPVGGAIDGGEDGMVPPRGPNGPPTGSEWSPHGGTPTSSTSSTSKERSLRARDLVAAANVVADGEIDDFLTWILASHKISNADAWLKKVASSQDGFQPLADRWRASKSASNSSQTGTGFGRPRHQTFTPADSTAHLNGFTPPPRPAA